MMLPKVSRPLATVALLAALTGAIPAAPPRTELVVPQGARLSVRLNHALSTQANKPGDRFTAVLVEPLRAGGAVAVPKGASVSGIVHSAQPSGRLKGRALLSLALDRIEWPGHSYALHSVNIARVSPRHRKRNWTWIGGGSGAGALIGGLATGGAGAVIGAGAGAAAGAAGAAFTGRKHVQIPAESLLTFQLRAPLIVRVPASSERR